MDTPHAKRLDEAMRHYAEFARGAPLPARSSSSAYPTPRRVAGDGRGTADSTGAAEGDRWRMELEAARGLLAESDASGRDWSPSAWVAEPALPAFPHSKKERKLGSPPRSRKLGSPPRGRKLVSPPRSKLASPQRSPSRGMQRRRPASRSLRDSPAAADSVKTLRDRVAQLEAELLAEQATRRAIVADHQAAQERWALHHAQTVKEHEREMQSVRAVAAKSVAQHEKVTRQGWQQGSHSAQPQSPSAHPAQGKDQARSMKAAIRELQQLKRQVKEMEAERAAERVRARVRAAEEQAEEQRNRQERIDPAPHPAPNSVWAHYKHTPAASKRYRVVGVAAHSETGVPLVVYRSLYGDRQLWARPLRMWAEQVHVAQPWPDGPEQTRPRFVLQPQPQRREGSTEASMPAVPAAHASRYIALVQVLLRQRSDLSSAKVGTLSQGEEIEILERADVDGALRVRCLCGWASVSTRKGKPLLQALDDDNEKARMPQGAAGAAAPTPDQPPHAAAAAAAAAAAENSVVVAQLADLASHIDEMLDDDQSSLPVPTGSSSVSNGGNGNGTTAPRSIFQRTKSPSPTKSATSFPAAAATAAAVPPHGSLPQPSPNGYARFGTPRAADAAAAQASPADATQDSVSVTVHEHEGKLGLDFGIDGADWPVVQTVAADGLLAQFPEIQPGLRVTALDDCNGGPAQDLTGLSFRQAFEMFRKADRPLTLTFLTQPMAAAEGANEGRLTPQGQDQAKPADDTQPADSDSNLTRPLLDAPSEQPQQQQRQRRQQPSRSITLHVQPNSYLPIDVVRTPPFFCDIVF